MRQQLILESVSKSFGGLTAVDDVTYTFAAGQVTAIVGDNGSGKTTLFNLITGTLRPDHGRVLWNDRRIDTLPVWRTARLGVGRLFQEVRIFPKLSVLENVLVGFPSQVGETIWGVLALPWMVRRTERRNRTKAEEILRFVGLEDRGEQWAESLSYGKQKLLAIARLLANGTQLLLLDEPTAGIDPQMKTTLMELIRRLADGGRTVVVIEHDMDVVAQLAHTVLHMDRGKIEPSRQDKEAVMVASQQIPLTSRGSVYAV